jgi:hypothetical protein
MTPATLTPMARPGGPAGRNLVGPTRIGDARPAADRRPR